MKYGCRSKDSCTCYEGIWGSGGIAPLMLHLGTDGGEWSPSCCNLLTLGKQPLVITEQKARWVPKLFLTLDKRKISCFCWVSNHRFFVTQSYWLNCPIALFCPQK